MLIAGLSQTSVFLNVVLNKPKEDDELQNEGESPEMFAMHLRGGWL